MRSSAAAGSRVRPVSALDQSDAAEPSATSTVSSPFQVHGVAKAPARRAPDLGEHNEAILQELGFDAKDIDGLRASGAVPKAREHAA